MMLKHSAHFLLAVNESTLSQVMVCWNGLRLKVRRDSKGCGGCGGSLAPSQSVAQSACGP